MRLLGLVLLVSAVCLAGCYQSVSVDVIPDGGADGSLDAGTDAGADGGTDAGVDAGTDAGVDAGTDAGMDAGMDAGTEPPVCVELCESLPDWTAEQRSCVVQALRLAGYKPGDLEECQGVRSPEACADCADALGVSDGTCASIAFICLPSAT